MIILKQNAMETAEFLKEKFQTIPHIAFFTGTGLGDAANFFTIEKKLPYKDIPHFSISTVQSHEGALLLARDGQHSVLIFQGRFHLYEGHSPQKIAFPIRVLKALGVDTLILSNASGGLNPDYQEGDIMVIADHINLMGENPLVGEHDDSLGERFPHMAKAYDNDLIRLIAETGKAKGYPLQNGVYVGLKGPSLETPAEMRYLRTIGADAVGFSTVMETITAVQEKIRVLGLSTITNMNIPDRLQPSSVEEIIAVAQKAAPAIADLVKTVMKAQKDR